jgi:hypothetical protein
MINFRSFSYKVELIQIVTMPRKDNRRNIFCILCFVTLVIIILLAVIIYLATRGPTCPGKCTSLVYSL